LRIDAGKIRRLHLVSVLYPHEGVTVRDIYRISIAILLAFVFACSATGSGDKSDSFAEPEALSIVDARAAELALDDADSGTLATDSVAAETLEAEVVAADASEPAEILFEITSDCPNATAPAAFTPDDLKQTLKIGTTEIDILFWTPLPGDDDPEHLTFDVAFTNHTCSIPGYKDELVGKTTLVNSEGLSTDDFTYGVKSKDSHHGTGILKVARFLNGKDLIGCDTTSLTLTLTDIDGGDPTFTWGEEFLSGLK
jgi:hypothetical protein